MAFYYAKEKRKFDHEWEQLREEYEAAGMLEKDIQELYEFDLQWFRSSRRFINHTQNLPAETNEGEDGGKQSSLIRKFSSFSTNFDESQLGGRYGWIENIGDRRLLDKLRKLSVDDMELLTLIAIEEYNQTEVSRLLGCSQKNISLKIGRIKKFLKNI